MSLQPTPIIAEVSDVTGALPASVQLDGTGSLPAEGPPAGTYISEWRWTLHHKPEGSAATLTNSETATPTLTNIDMVGSYLISLQVTDDLGRTSHTGINPIQSTAPPYGFKFPAITSMVAVRVPTVSGLVKLAYGERKWLERGLWELVDRIEENTNAITGLQANIGDSVASADTIYVNNINELTGGHDVRFLAPVRLDTLKGRTDPARIDVDAALVVDGAVTASTGNLTTLNSNEAYVAQLDTPNIATASALSIAAASINLGSETESVAVASANDITLTATDDITLTATDDISLETFGPTGSISLQTTGSNADITLSAAGSDGDITILAPGPTGVVAVLGGGGGVSLTTITDGANITLTAAGVGSLINLAPEVSTNTTKPVFAPGFSYVDTYTASGGGKPLMPEVSFTRHTAGSDMVVDMLSRLSLPKPEVATLSVRRTIGSTEVLLATFDSDMSEGTGDLYMRVRCVTRKPSDTKLITHITCDVSDAITFELHETKQIFVTHTTSAPDSLLPVRFNFDWLSGDVLTDMDSVITARLTNGHTRDVL
jgi:hypothetical protein